MTEPNETKFLVSYTIGQYFSSDGEPVLKETGYTMIVSGHTRGEAFVTAYWILVKKGYMVCTSDTSEDELITARMRNRGEFTPTADPISAVAGLTQEEMKEIYNKGIPIVYRGSRAMAEVVDIRTLEETEIGERPSFDKEPQAAHYVDPQRITELRAIKGDAFDLRKLIELCDELNHCFDNRSFLAVAILTRTILDHIPPIFGFLYFAEVVNSYKGTRSFKEIMQHLETSSRRIADSHLHTPIRKKEILPTLTQVNFSNDLDVLLAEIIRILK